MICLLHLKSFSFSLDMDMPSRELLKPVANTISMSRMTTDLILLIIQMKRRHFLVADTQLYKRLCPSVGPSVGPLVGPLVSTSRKVGKRAFPPLPTRPQLMAAYPALFFQADGHLICRSVTIFLRFANEQTSALFKMPI